MIILAGILRAYAAALVAAWVEGWARGLPRPPEPPSSPPEPAPGPSAYTPAAGLVEARQAGLRERWCRAWAERRRPYQHLDAETAWERYDLLERCIADEFTEPKEEPQ
jgi:hypothetical protein